jgi:DNA-binding transcriptional regulator YdaS (Cro superfamily)
MVQRKREMANLQAAACPEVRLLAAVIAVAIEDALAGGAEGEEAANWLSHDAGHWIALMGLRSDWLSQRIAGVVHVAQEHSALAPCESAGEAVALAG